MVGQPERFKLMSAKAIRLSLRHGSATAPALPRSAQFDWPPMNLARQRDLLAAGPNRRAILGGLSRHRSWRSGLTRDGRSGRRWTGWVSLALSGQPAHLRERCADHGGSAAHDRSSGHWRHQRRGHKRWHEGRRHQRRHQGRRHHGRHQRRRDRRRAGKCHRHAGHICQRSTDWRPGCSGRCAALRFHTFISPGRGGRAQCDGRSDGRTQQSSPHSCRDVDSFKGRHRR